MFKIILGIYIHYNLGCKCSFSTSREIVVIFVSARCHRRSDVGEWSDGGYVSARRSKIGIYVVGENLVAAAVGVSKVSEKKSFEITFSPHCARREIRITAACLHAEAIR